MLDLPGRHSYPNASREAEGQAYYGTAPDRPPSLSSLAYRRTKAL
jgi:hypothetical protein